MIGSEECDGMMGQSGQYNSDYGTRVMVIRLLLSGCIHVSGLVPLTTRTKTYLLEYSSNDLGSDC